MMEEAVKATLVKLWKLHFVRFDVLLWDTHEYFLKM